MKNLLFQFCFQKDNMDIKMLIEILSCYQSSILMPDFCIIVDNLQQILNIFFCTVCYRTKKVSDSINIALKKIRGQCVTAAEIRSDVNKLKGLVCQDQAYLFLRNIPGTPPYWQKFMYEVI